MERLRFATVGSVDDGKSTLMRVLARRQEPDSGRVTWRRDLRVGFLEQRDSLDPAAEAENSTSINYAVG